MFFEEIPENSAEEQAQIDLQDAQEEGFDNKGEAGKKASYKEVINKAQKKRVDLKHDIEAKTIEETSERNRTGLQHEIRHFGRLPSKPRRPKLKESMRRRHNVHFEKEVQRFVRMHRNNYRQIMNATEGADGLPKGNALKPVESEPGKTRFQYAQEAFGNSKILPDYLKKMLPLVPFQESSFDPGLKENSSKAAGAWQFTRGAAKDFKLSLEDRLDYKKSTDAAVKNFEDIYIKLERHKYYKTLKDRYGLRDQDFLGYMVVNAYNCGMYHMIRVMRIMVNPSEAFRGKKNRKMAEGLKDQVREYAHSGREGLFSFLTEQYSHKLECQGICPTYRHDSREYVYHIIAYQKLYREDQSAKAKVPKIPKKAADDLPKPPQN